MKAILPLLFCLIAGLFCLGMGIWVIINPIQIATQIDFEFVSNAGLSEFMTVYGGFFSGIGVFLMISALQRRYQEAALLALFLASLGSFSLRTYGLLHYDLDPFFIQMLAIEAFLTIIGFIGFWIARSSRL